MALPADSMYASFETPRTVRTPPSTERLAAVTLPRTDRLPSAVNAPSAVSGAAVKAPIRTWAELVRRLVAVTAAASSDAACAFAVTATDVFAFTETPMVAPAVT